MSELNSENSYKKESQKHNNPAKKTFFGIIIFTIICIIITITCIYITLSYRNNNTHNIAETPLSTNNNIFYFNEPKNKYETLKLVDKTYINHILENTEKECYGEQVEYYEYSNESIMKLEVEYLQIDGLKNKNVQSKINEVISDKVIEEREKYLKQLDNEDIDRISISANIMGNFSDVLSVNVNVYVHYDYNDNDYENDKYQNDSYGLNFSLKDGNQIKFKDMFWEDSPIKLILSQSLYKDLAWKFAYYTDDENWDWNMEGKDYSVIESKVYNFMEKYNKNPDLNFYFTPKNIEISLSHGTYDTYSIEMADFYEYIAICTKYKSKNNLYEGDPELDEFYVFSNDLYVSDDSIKINEKKSDNIYCKVYGYDSIDQMDDEGKKSLKAAEKEISKVIDEYVETLKVNKDYGYIIEAMYLGGSEYEGKYGYSIDVQVSACSRKYFDEHLEDALAAGARAEKAESSPTSYEYVDEENFEFYESYMEWTDDYTDESTKNINVYTKEDRDKDYLEWENEIIFQEEQSI